MFDFSIINLGANLLINSPEQIFTEKMKSLLKFNIRSTRYKDLLNEDYEKVKAMMIIVLFIRTQRALKYSKSDFLYYYKKYEELINL